MAKWISTDIFRHTDYLQYLIDVCKTNRCTDYAAEFYGMLVHERCFVTQGFINDIFNGNEATLSVNHCIHISKALGHTDTEAEYFRCLVALSQAGDEKETRCFEEMRKEIADKNGARTELIDKDRYEFYAQWYHSAVRALISSLNDSDDVYQQLEKRMLLPVSEIQIKQSVELLSRLGFIRKDRNGEYLIATEKNIKTGEDFSWEEKKQIHQQYLKLAGDILSEDDIEPNKVSSHVLGISGKTFEQICNYTDELKKKISTLVENEEQTDRVYLYQFVLVPLTSNCSTEQ